MARKIKELHQNQNNMNQKNIDYYYNQNNEQNVDKRYILSKMKDAYGQKGNYHLNEYNIEYSPSSSALDKVSNRKNNFRIKYFKKNKEINIINKKRGKSSYSPYNIEKEEINNNNNEIISDMNKISKNKKIEKSFLNDMSNISNIKKDDEKNKTDKLYYTFDNNNNNNFQTNIINYFMSCKFLLTMSFNEIEEYLKTLWKKMGVKLDYINIFNFQKNNFNNEEEKTDFLILEIENLKKFEEIIIKLKKEIESREKNINDIKKLTEEMKQIEESENSINTEKLNNKKIMNSFFNLIISYRVHSIKVVEYYLLFKEKIVQGNFGNKFNEEFIQKKYGLLNENGIKYLLKMKNDMNFLTNLKLYNNKNIENIFESFKGDPFLSSLYNIIPVSREYKQRIKYCEYFIMQENLYDKKNTKKNIIINDHILNEASEYKNYQKKKLEPINNINKYKTEINEKEYDFKNMKNNKIKEKGKENNKISEFNYDENLNINTNDDIVNLNTKKEKIKINCEKDDIKSDINEISTKKEVENILQNSLTLSKKMKKKEDSRPVTPESKKLIKKEINSKEIKDYNISYYCGSLTDFIFIYNDHYQRIPLEQKRIFNIKSNALEYFYHNYYPKIIICSDTKLSLTKGICVYSLLLNNENKPNKIIIEHLSSYNQEEMTYIFKNIFDFLKSNNMLTNSLNDINIEIYIDLYFYLEQEKFVIDINIRDFIKNELKFKWVKLENISKEIRFQKMKHKFSNNNNSLLNNEIDDNNILNQSIIGKKALKDLNETNDDFFLDDNLISNFIIKNKTVIKYIDKTSQEKKIKNNIIFTNIKYINTFNIIYLIKKIPEDCIYSEYIENNTNNFFSNDEHLDIEEILNNNDGVSLDDIIVNNSFFNYDLEQLKQFFDNKYNKKEKNDKNKFKINAIMNIFPLFDNCISVKYKNYYYNRIENENMKTLIEKETKQIFYFVTPNNNKNDNIILLISSSLNDEFIKKYINEQLNSNLSLKFIDIYNNITSYESNNTKKYIYIPSFDINSKIKLNYKKNESPGNQEDLNENKDDIFIMNKYEEFFKIKFISEDLIELNKNKNKKNKISSSINFYYDKIKEDFIQNKDCIIDNNFIIFFLNFDIIDNFAAIPLLSLYITKQNFISDKID